MKLLSVAAAFALLVPTAAMIHPLPAQAGTTNCGSSAWWGRYYPVRTRTVKLRNGRVFQIQLMNERLSDESHADLNRYQSGDRTWIDRSTDGGRTWFQCGPFNSDVSNEMDNIGVHMRACAWSHDTHETFCTNWYYDKD